MEGRQRNGNKRHSGVFDKPITVPQRRTSKNTPSGDRNPLATDDDRAEKSSRVDTSNKAFKEGFQDGSCGSPPSGSATSESVSRSLAAKEAGRELYTRVGIGGNDYTGGSERDMPSRPRTRTLEERVRDSSPSATVAKGRNRLGSLHALSPLDGLDEAESSSIGFPSIDPPRRPLQHPRRLVKSPPRALSPTIDNSIPTIPALPSPSSDTSKILQLMKTTCGRMHGILFFRTTKTGPWSSGYCAINVASGSLIYQMKGDVSHAKTLVPDLRGCKVRSQVDKESKMSFLEISTRTSGLGIHLRPHVPETFDSWLAALLCWQPLRPKGAQNKMTKSQASIGGERRIGNSSRRNSTILANNAAIIKVGKMLCWDHDARVGTPASPARRISTYKQQRSASGTPWRKISCTLQENGQLKLYMESNTTLMHLVPLCSLSRCAIQRLHPTVLDDEYCLAIYPQYTASNVDPELQRPIYLSLESRVLFEVWFVLLRAFTIPQLYGPEQSSLRGSVDLSASNGELRAPRTENMFRVERSLFLRVIESKVYVPRDMPETYTQKTRAGSAHGKDYLPGDYHAEVILDGEVRGRTAVKTNTPNPFFREDYDFNDLPPVLTNASIALKSRSPGQKDWTLISDDRYDYDLNDVDSLGKAGNVQVLPLDTVVGSVNLRLDDMERGKDIEKWWSIVNDHDKVVGDFLIKTRLEETIVLMSEDYKPLSELLHSFSNGLTQEIAFACPAEARRLPETLLNIFQVSGQAGNWIMSLVEDEIDGIHKDTPVSRFRYSRRIASNDSYDSVVEREMLVRDLGKNATAEAHLLFRGNSLLTKALDFHMRRVGKDYLEETLGESMRDIDESNPDCEVDPNRVRNSEDLQRNWRNLTVLTENVWRSIAASASRCPPELRIILRHIRSCAEDRYGDFLRTVAYSSVSGFLFLRFFCPAVLNPKLFGLLKGGFEPSIYE